MNFFPDVETLDKLLSNDWKSLVYGEKSETWNEKIYSIAGQAWNEIFEFLDSRGRQLKNYWPLYGALFVGSFIVFATYKSLRYVRTIEFRKIVKYGRRGNEEICIDVSRINSNDDNGEIENLSQNLCPIFLSHIDDATTTSPPDINRDEQHESLVPSDDASIAINGNQSGQFLKNFINSIPLGDDAVHFVVATKHSTKHLEDNQKTLNLPESTPQKLDSNDFNESNLPIPSIGPSEAQEPRDPEVLLHLTSITADCTKNESINQLNSTSKVLIPKETIKNVIEHENPIESTPRKATTSNITNIVPTNDAKTTSSVQGNSTLAINHESSSVCCADELLSRTSEQFDYNFSIPNIEKPIESSTNEKNESNCDNLEVVFINFVQKLPELDLSPISRQPVIADDAKNITESKPRTDSNHRFRSLSHDNRTASNAGYIDNRRGSSVSPPARHKNKQRFVTQMPSKIPTLSPLNHRAFHGHVENDGKVEETANQIRSVLLRKLKQVWEQHPRDKTPSPDRSLDSSLESSIYYTPECVSKIPLPRRSPRAIVASDETRSSVVGSQRTQSPINSEQSRPGYSEKPNEPCLPDDPSMVPLHSTPKMSPLSRESRHKR